jgi:hypothetical protein
MTTLFRKGDAICVYDLSLLLWVHIYCQHCKDHDFRHIFWYVCATDWFIDTNPVIGSSFSCYSVYHGRAVWCTFDCLLKLLNRTSSLTFTSSLFLWYSVYRLHSRRRIRHRMKSFEKLNVTSNVVQGSPLYVAAIDTEMGNVCLLSCLYAEVDQVWV